MPFKLFDFLNDHGKNEFKEWCSSLQKDQKGKLNNRLDQLALHGDTLMPEILAGTDVAGILKLRIRGNVQLRPMLTKGPISVTGEYTLLLGAKEIGGILEPKKAPEIADKNKAQIIKDPKNRRAKHERIT